MCPLIPDCSQAHAFQQGLKLNPTDKTLRQGFWDAIALVAQNRTDGDPALQRQIKEMQLAEELGSPAAAATATASVAAATAGVMRLGTGPLGTGSKPGTAHETESGLDPAALATAPLP